MALMSTNISNAIPKPRAIIVPEISIIWTIQRLLYRALEAQVKPLCVF